MTLIKPAVFDITTGELRNIAAGETLDATVANPEVRAFTNNEVGAVVFGAPVYFFSAGGCKKAKADAAGTANVCALVADASISGGASGNYTVNGPLTAATTGLWDAVVTGGSGGLTFGTRYYLDPANAGKLVAGASGFTTGQYIVCVGQGENTLTMDVKIEIKMWPY